jgi:hypothetical protein
MVISFHRYYLNRAEDSGFKAFDSLRLAYLQCGPISGRRPNADEKDLDNLYVLTKWVTVQEEFMIWNFMTRIPRGKLYFGYLGSQSRPRWSLFCHRIKWRIPFECNKCSLSPATIVCLSSTFEKKSSSFTCHQSSDLSLLAAYSESEMVPISSLVWIGSDFSFDSNSRESSFKKSFAFPDSSGLPGSVCDDEWI